MKLIDKDALVAEIVELKEKIPTSCTWGDDIEEGSRIGEDSAYCRLLSFINTLEVKEVDLEKEYKEYVEDDPVYNKLVNGIVGMSIAKYFFELGLKVNNEKEK